MKIDDTSNAILRLFKKSASYSRGDASFEGFENYLKKLQKNVFLKTMGASVQQFFLKLALSRPCGALFGSGGPGSWVFGLHFGQRAPEGFTIMCDLNLPRPQMLTQRSLARTWKSPNGVIQARSLDDSVGAPAKV